MKQQSISIKRYFEVVHPEYTYLKLIPLKSIRNYNSDKIILAIASTYRNILQRVRKQEKKYFFKTQWKVSFFILIEKQNVEFYFMIPKECLSLIREKIGDTWSGITIQLAESLPTFGHSALRYCMGYRREDALSLAADKRTNTLLESLLSTVDVMEEGDKLGVLYNFIPRDQQSWRARYDKTIDKLQGNLPIEKNSACMFALQLLAMAFVKASEFLSDIFADFTGGGNDAKPKSVYHETVLIPATYKKRETTNVDAQIIALSESTELDRRQNNAIAVCESYNSISGDNELLYRKISAPVKNEMLSIYYPGADRMRMSAAECSNFIALPGRELLERYKSIEHIDIVETEVPEELRHGVVRVGVNTYRGAAQDAYLTSDPEYKHLSLVLIGPTRSGKTTYISNIADDSVTGGQCTILFDFCGNCELSNDVSKCVDNVLTIDCADFSDLQGLGYNEVNQNEPDTFLRYRNAKMQTMQLITLINSIVEDDNNLSARMDRYLECAALVTFLSGGSIADVFRVLQDFQYRREFIQKVPEAQKDNMAEYIQAILELDDTDKKTNEVCGTKFSLISGIVDRVNRLKQNAYMELMLKRDCSHNINLVDEMQKPQLICLRMPDAMFATESEKDIYCTYWMTKIWLALQIRKRDYPNRISVNVVVDELYQVPQCQDFIRSKLSQMAKFSAKMIISCHYLGQIKIIRNELKAANSSYIILAGSDKDNFAELKEELSPFEVEDVLALKRYHALCLLKISDGYARFVAKLPPTPDKTAA